MRKFPLFGMQWLSGVQVGPVHGDRRDTRGRLSVQHGQHRCVYFCFPSVPTPLLPSITMYSYLHRLNHTFLPSSLARSTRLSRSPRICVLTLPPGLTEPIAESSTA